VGICVKDYVITAFQPDMPCPDQLARCNDLLLVGIPLWRRYY
jgi:hypothetical protein